MYTSDAHVTLFHFPLTKGIYISPLRRDPRGRVVSWFLSQMPAGKVGEHLGGRLRGTFNHRLER